MESRVAVFEPHLAAERRFKASVTAVRWHGRPIHYDPYTPAPPLAELELDFSWLPSSRPLALFRFMTGLYAYHSQRYALAAAAFTEALSQAPGDVEQPRATHQLLGLSLLYRGQPSAAREALQKAYDGCAATDVSCQIVGLNLLGWSQARLGDRKQALEQYERALMLARTVGAPFTEVTTLMAIGDLYSVLGEKVKAIEQLDLALTKSRQVSDRPSEAVALLLNGDFHNTFGNQNRALELYEQVLPIASQEAAQWLHALALGAIGNVYVERGLPDSLFRVVVGDGEMGKSVPSPWSEMEKWELRPLSGALATAWAYHDLCFDLDS
jgi:tetratricopeptide (TPR) repeat protein